MGAGRPKLQRAAVESWQSHGARMVEEHSWLLAYHRDRIDWKRKLGHLSKVGLIATGIIGLTRTEDVNFS